MYNISNWYWLAADGRIYSSAKQAIIKAKDKDFAAWKEQGNLPTPWPKNVDGKETEDALSRVLEPYGILMFAPTFEQIKQNLKTLIDNDAETQRLKYITNGVGQSMTYTEKVNQAAAYSKAYMANKADPENVPAPTDGEYSLLASSLGIDGNTLLEVAETVTYAYAQWQQIGAGIEGVRLLAKLVIDEAKTVEEAQVVYDGIKWP